MDFKTSQKLYSNARMGKYLKACTGNQLRTMQLYRYNLRLCQRFYGILNLFEVILRNAVNEHYMAYYSDSDWIVNQTGTDKILAHDKDEIKQIEADYKKRGIYNNDKMVSALTFGFWTYLFTKKNYRKGGKTLLKIFPNKAKGKNQADIYLDLTHIREFRNRIAHHEPICFRSGTDSVSTDFLRNNYCRILKLFDWMGISSRDYLFGIDRVGAACAKIDKISNV